MAKNPFLVAIDDGYAQIKIFGSPLDGSDPIRKVFRTSVRSGRHRIASIDGGGFVDCYRAEEGDEFTVSEEVESENTQFDSFHTSTMNRVLAHHGLALAGYRDRNVELITGLPVADYFSPDGAINEEKIRTKTGNLLKSVASISPETKLARIVGADIGCQAVAALFDYALDDNLKPRVGVDISGPVAIVDIGGRTTDIAVISGGSKIDTMRSGTSNLGVLDVYKSLEQALHKKFGFRDTLPIKDLDLAIRTHKIRMWNKVEEIGDLVKAAVREIETQIEREVERKLSSAATMNAVVFVGGGAALFPNAPKQLRNGVTVEDPEFANARGLWKFARLQQRKQGRNAA